MYRMDDLKVPTWIGNLIPIDLMILVMIFRPFMVRSLWCSQKKRWSITGPLWYLMISYDILPLWYLKYDHKWPLWYLMIYYLHTCYIENRVSVSGWSPYRLWRCSLKFEHPMSTPYYFSIPSIPLILSVTHVILAGNHPVLVISIFHQGRLCSPNPCDLRTKTSAGKGRSSQTGHEFSALSTLHWVVNFYISDPQGSCNLHI